MSLKRDPCFFSFQTARTSACSVCALDIGATRLLVRVWGCAVDSSTLLLLLLQLLQLLLLLLLLLSPALLHSLDIFAVGAAALTAGPNGQQLMLLIKEILTVLPDDLSQSTFEKWTEMIMTTLRMRRQEMMMTGFCWVPSVRLIIPQSTSFRYDYRLPSKELVWWASRRGAHAGLEHGARVWVQARRTCCTGTWGTRAGEMVSANDSTEGRNE